MRRNWVFVLAVSLIGCIVHSTVLFSQDSATKPPEAEERVYKVGSGVVTAPRATYRPAAEYDDYSRKKKTQGTVVLSLIVTKEGQTKDIVVERSLSPQLDAQAIKAVSQWRFDPATKNGEPVAVKIRVEVDFHLR